MVPLVFTKDVNDDITKLSQKSQGCLADKMHGMNVMNKDKGSAGLTNLLVHEAYLKDASCFSWKTEENEGCKELEVTEGRGERGGRFGRFRLMQPAEAGP